MAIAALVGIVSGVMLMRGPANLDARPAFDAEPAREQPLEQMVREASARAYSNSFVATNGMRMGLSAQASEPAMLATDLPRERLDRFSERDREAR
jgi:hypothetical protein